MKSYVYSIQKNGKHVRDTPFNDRKLDKNRNRKYTGVNKHGAEGYVHEPTINDMIPSDLVKGVERY